MNSAGFASRPDTDPRASNLANCRHLLGKKRNETIISGCWSSLSVSQRFRRLS